MAKHNMSSRSNTPEGDFDFQKLSEESTSFHQAIRSIYGESPDFNNIISNPAALRDFLAHLHNEIIRLKADLALANRSRYTTESIKWTSRLVQEVLNKAPAPVTSDTFIAQMRFPIIGHGWSGPKATGSSNYRTMLDSSATIVIPYLGPGKYRIAILYIRFMDMNQHDHITFIINKSLKLIGRFVGVGLDYQYGAQFELVEPAFSGFITLDIVIDLTKELNVEFPGVRNPKEIGNSNAVAVGDVLIQRV